MRAMLLIATLAAALPGTAFAGAMTTISGPSGTADIVDIGCPSCVKEAPKPKAPTLAPGHELIALKDVAGKTKVFRTENWLGGSPVTYVTTPDATELASLKADGITVAGTPRMIAPGTRSVVAVASRDGVDPARTGSVKPFDAATLKLRLKPVVAGQ